MCSSSPASRATRAPPRSSSSAKGSKVRPVVIRTEEELFARARALADQGGRRILGIAGTIAVPREIPLVVTEGNYLLLWPDIKPLLDECWYVDTDEELRVQRLIQRHIQFGKTPEYARAWVMRSDEHNAALVAGEGR